MPTVRIGPVIGLITQIALVAILAATVGLGVAGWLAAGAYGVVTCVVLTSALRQLGAVSLRPADRVTLTRATLVGCVVALTADTFDGPAPGAVVVTIATVALVLDAVDGHVARRTGTASALGARFDMEVDAFLILVLSVYVARSMGWWILAIGAMRYAFVVAGWALAWLPGPLPPRYWRKVVAATQGIVLVGAAAGVLPRSVTISVLVAALALLVESFGHDIAWRWRWRPATDRSQAVGLAGARSSRELGATRVDAPQFAWGTSMWARVRSAVRTH